MNKLLNEILLNNTTRNYYNYSNLQLKLYLVLLVLVMIMFITLIIRCKVIKFLFHTHNFIILN